MKHEPTKEAMPSRIIVTKTQSEHSSTSQGRHATARAGKSTSRTEDLASNQSNPPLRGISSRERIVHAVLNGLYAGRYRPGERLVESRLTEEFCVSRGPVREALNRLSAMGIVSLTLQRGAQIRELSFRDAVDTLVIVQTLVGLAAELAAERIEFPGGAARLQQALDRVSRFDQPSSSADYAIARDDFYAALVQLGGNRELGRALLGMQTHLVRVQFGYITESLPGERRKDYQAIATAISERDATRARSVARRHIGRALKRLRESRQATR